MKKRLLFISALSALCVTAISISANKAVGVSAAASAWEEVGATTKDIAGGANIIGSGWGARAHTAYMYVLDGLEFDFEFENIASEHTAGFYFGKEHYYYAPQTGETDNALTFYFNSSATYYGYNQCRFGIFNTHAWSGKTAQSYTSTNLATADGFGYSDGTLVMNKKDSHKFHFDFSKVDSTWYKVTMKELTEGSMWTGAGFNKNYDATTHSTFVYVKASQIAFNDKGEVYLYAFGFTNSSINITGIENNYQPVLAFCKNYLSKDDVPTSDTRDTGACLTKYNDAKTAFNNLTAAQKTMFLTDARFSDMVARMQAWAVRNGEVFGNDGVFSSSSLTISNNIQNLIPSFYVIGTISLVLLVSLTYFFVLRKRKRLSK